jgi:hypothetical protein
MLWLCDVVYEGASAKGFETICRELLVFYYIPYASLAGLKRINFIKYNTINATVWIVILKLLEISVPSTAKETLSWQPHAT